MRAFALALLFLAGCAHTAVGVGNAHPVTPTGGVHVNAGGALGAAVLIGVAATASTQEVGDPQATMAPERDVSEQDCTQPIVESAANLKCR